MLEIKFEQTASKWWYLHLASLLLEWRCLWWRFAHTHIRLFHIIVMFPSTSFVFCQNATLFHLLPIYAFSLFSSSSTPHLLCAFLHHQKILTQPGICRCPESRQIGPCEI
jgi:hypothetical protein